ncbi:putative disease resistance RPP13-like protein 1 [Arachis stenosperma]|uniref:putative disease resistance RPP13-like protein 1 n=1 Tax=Arachis stenosperma TaxID=217475 RepID=UPI0025ABC8CC|nr:putative disease resistance RPP13-like protein 1 [Arachis stenosperma]XP_057743030.1 putative disease resistance RPP13-like protein 1 [Arachis stenosperma]XP_057743032.1 putative disease resistance RPP13-like protein 1 [Arachis stenosperma]XP_057743033.1 putative disease resistance RPP13-like protein 1 [Arachis stenosperma]XP_057743034.1 putative disease resistance RPP13-like protein 1 [Arachis stenosperma]XP_057743035.1 putative disease resistance RPP13-like protein 1 [Arachis stenosperma]
MAAKLDGGAYLTSFVDAVLDKLSSILEDDSVLNGNHSALELLRRLEISLYEVGPVLDDAEQKQFTNKRVKKWLLDLQDALYFADDLLNEISTKAAIAATQRDPSNSSSWSRLVDSYIEDTGDMEKIVGTLESVIAKKNHYRLKECAKVDMSSWRTPSTSLVVSSAIFGRDEDKEKIIKLLLDDTRHAESHVTVIPIVGMGGIGKTTLAQSVYNDNQVQQKFNVKAWVCVGEVFDILKVTKTVVEKAISASCNMNDLDSVQQRLRTEVTGKTFLVVLDDMWTIDYDDWKTFLAPFQCGSQGGKILVTTRIDAVASMVKTIPAHNLSLLDVEQCWLVFANHAFFATESRDRLALEKVGKKIVEKCKGLPLAAQSLGGLLRTKDNIRDWEDVLMSEIWEFSEDECRILPALRISYHYLPSHLKRCFVYCSLYPKDYVLSSHELVSLWMAEDLLQQPKSGSILEEVGYKYLNDLAARSFFQPSKNGYEDSFVMHNLMHDLATFYGKKFFVRISEHENVGQHDTKTRHLSYDVNDNNSVPKMLEACESSSHVRTLFRIKADLYRQHELGIDPGRLLAQLKRLRVLSFKSFKIDILPDSIGELIHLRYLNLSNTLVVTLPESLNNLYNLQTLKLAECKKLKKLPSNMQNLVNLRHLDISGTDNLEEMPKKMSKLKDLQFLSGYIAGKHEENGIGELGELTHLHGSLWIKKLENVKNSGEASNARMDEKIHLNALDFSWSSFEESEVCDSQNEKDVLDKLRPHKDLKKLFMWGYRGTMFPDWVGQSSYHNMTWLKLWGCRNCWVLPSLGQLPSLESLVISELDKVKKIDESFYKGDGTHQHQETPFRSLKYLTIQKLPCWEEWESYECDDDDDAPFPKLEWLGILNCPKLRGDLPTFLPSLEKLRIERCEELGCYLPRAPILRELIIDGKQEARMRDLPLSMLEKVVINGEQLVNSVFEAMTHTQPTSLTELSISNCSSVVSFPGDALPPSLKELRIYDCKNVEFPRQHQQHHSLQELEIYNSCDSLTSFALPPFPNLLFLTIQRCENLTSLELSQSQSLQELWIVECPKLENIIRLPASLSRLSIRECGLLGEGIERKDPHIWPSISHIPVIFVDEKLIQYHPTS